MNWTDDFQGAITVCDRDGIVVYQNERSKKMFSADGSETMIGQSLIDCHPEPARSKLLEMLKKPHPNSYTIEKRGIHKMIHQTPWVEKDEFMGVVEISFEIPANLPHFVRR